MSRRIMACGIVCLSFGLQSCATGIFGKYNQPKPARKVVQSQNMKKGKTASIFSIDQNTFRFHLTFSKVWNSAIDVLLENYNLNIVDRKSGIITTEWDSFYLENKVYRNKVSVRVKKLAYNMVDVTIHNSVETLQNIGNGGLASAWLPHPKNHEEMGRLIHNMAINLGQPKPVLPREMMATYGKGKPQQTAQ